MLAILATKPAVSRERIAVLLWPEASAGNARKLLSEALYVVRRELADTAVIAHGAELRLNEGVIGSDLAEFRAAFVSGDFETAARCYGGPFLDGWYIDDAPEFDRWVEEARDELARDHAGALQSLATASEQAGAWADAARWWRKLCMVDRYNSRFALRYALALSATGERSAALQLLSAHADVLRDELGVTVHEDVRRLAERLRDGSDDDSRLLDDESLSIGPSALRVDESPAPRVTDALGQSSPLSVGETSHPRRFHLWEFRPWTAATLSAIALAIAIVWWVEPIGFRWAGTMEAPTRRIAGWDPRHVAIRTFSDLTGNNAELRGSIPDQLIAGLSGIAAIRVVPRSSMLAVDSAVPVDSLAEAYHVGTIVDGTISRFGDSIRVRATISDASTGSVVAHATYAGSSDNPFQTIDAAAIQIDSLLRTYLGRIERQTELRRGTVSVPAARYVAAGQRALEAGSARANEFSVTPATRLLLEADSLFARAQEADPRWTIPPIKRAVVAKILAGIQGASAMKTLTEGIAFANTALERDSASAAAREILGILHWRRARLFATGTDRGSDSTTAVNALRGATLRDSLRVGAWVMRARIAWSNADAQSAREFVDIASRNDPYFDGQSDMLESLFLAQLWLRDWEGARRSCNNGRRQDPDNFRFRQCYLTLLRYTATTAQDAAIAWAIVDSLERTPISRTALAAGRPYVPLYWRAAAAMISARVGDRTRAANELRKLEAVAAAVGESEAFAPDRSIVYWFLGERILARDILATYLDKRPEESAKAFADELLGPIAKRLPSDLRVTPRDGETPPENRSR